MGYVAKEHQNWNLGNGMLLQALCVQLLSARKEQRKIVIFDNTTSYEKYKLKFLSNSLHKKSGSKLPFYRFAIEIESTS